jgi:hypothetical protein
MTNIKIEVNKDNTEWQVGDILKRKQGEGSLYMILCNMQDSHPYYIVVIADAKSKDKVGRILGMSKSLEELQEAYTSMELVRDITMTIKG